MSDPEDDHDATDPDEPPSPPRAHDAWVLETDGGRIHPLDVVARDAIDPELASHGFRGRGRTWNRRVGDLIHVIHLDGTMLDLGGATRCSIYVHVGLFSPRLHELIWLDPVGDDVRPWLGYFSHHLPELVQGRGSSWPPLTADRSLARQGEVLADWIVEHGVTYLDRFTSTEAFCRAIVEEADRSGFVKDRLVLAYAAAMLGDGQRATHIVEELWRDTRDRRHLATYKRVADHLGVAAPDWPTPAEIPAELIPRHDDAATWELRLADCAGLGDRDDLLWIVERCEALGLSPSFGGMEPEPTPDHEAWIDHGHRPTDVWLRWKDTKRKLSRTRTMESWGSAVVRPGLGWTQGMLYVSRYGRDNWHLSIHVNTWLHAQDRVPIETYAASWADLLERIAIDLRPRLRPALTIILASGSYGDLVEDVERGRLLVGWRTWYGPSQVERHGRDFLLGLPDEAEELADGTVAHRLDVDPVTMVLPRRGKYTRVRPYLRTHGVEPGWPRL